MPFREEFYLCSVAFRRVLPYLSKGEQLLVLSANCQGLQNREKRVDVLNYLSKTNASIICLQDTHWSSKDEPIIRSIWKGDCILNGISSNSRGVAILFNTSVEYSIASSYKDNEGNLISLDLNLGDISIKLINLYAPNRDSPEFFEKIKEILHLSTQTFTMMVGDFNLILNPLLDCDQYKHLNNPRSRKVIFEIMTNFNLVDIFRSHHPCLKRYTWRRKNPIRQARLDYFLVTEAMQDIITLSSINPSYRSDHSNIQLKILRSKFERGRGLWKLNCSLLTQKPYLDLINSVITEEKQKYAIPVYDLDHIEKIPDSSIQFTISDFQFLEMLLLRIRGETIKFASFQKKKKNEQENNLVKEIADLEYNPCPNNLTILEDKKQKLENIREQTTQGIIIQSRAQWLNEGEKPSKYFCSLEKYNFVEKTIRCVQLDNGTKITDQKEILKELAAFYTRLFSPKNAFAQYSDIEHTLKNLKLRNLTHLEASNLEGELKLEEINKVLSKMKNNKSPGVDGFPAEFFKVFWGKLKHFVLRSLNASFTTGTMSISMRTCIINCLPKGDKPRAFLKNWRPISLLTVVYKLASAAIANRLKSVLPFIISKAQNGFLEGRFIGDTTRLVYDLMQYLEHNNLTGQLMLVDFQKAFDSVSWIFLNKVLSLYNFGKDFCKWIKIFNTDIKAYILQSGFLSDSINIGRGCRQGDPIAAYLFLLCAEVLYLLFEDNSNIKGISINNTIYKMTQFADDTTIFLDGTKDSLKAALNTLEIYGSLSGLKINMDKTKIVWLGKKKHSKDKFKINYKLEWGTTQFQLLGINFSTDLSEMPEINYTPILNEVTKTLNQWRRRNLTPIGKIAVIKTFVLSRLIHKLSSIPSPTDRAIKNLNCLFYSFIWDDKPHKISKKQITNCYIKGGLQMINLDNFIMAQKLVWIKRLSTSEAPWTNLLSASVSVKRLYTLGPMWSKILSEKTSNLFWKDVFKAWCIYLKQLDFKNTELLIVPLWYNSQISTGELFYPHWYQAGLTMPLDMLKSDGNIFTMLELRHVFGIKTNFLEYYRIERIIKQLLKQSTSPDTYSRPILFPYLKQLTKSKTSSKHFYHTLSCQFVNENLRNKWNCVLNITLDDNSWDKIYKNCFKTVGRNDLIWLQFRILQRILGTRAYMSKINMIQNPTCRFCQSSPETIEHIFIFCPIVADFWKVIQRWLQHFGLYLTIEPPTILFGVLENDFDSFSKNLILLVAKKFIWTQIRKPKALIILDFHKYIKNIFIEQEYMAKVNNNLEKFYVSWSVLGNIALSNETQNLG